MFYSYTVIIDFTMELITTYLKPPPLFIRMFLIFLLYSEIPTRQSTLIVYKIIVP